MWKRIGAIGIVLAGCGNAPGAQDATTKASADDPATATTAAPASATAPAPANDTSPAPDVATAPPPDVAAGRDAGPPPAPVTRSGTVWPFHAWTRAEAVTFNRFPMRPDTPLVAYGEKGWSPHVAERRAIDPAIAKKAVELADATGDVEVSKCPFPRHAVVFFDGDTPVGSANVCFECGDLVLWPPYVSTVFAAAPAKERDKLLKRVKTAQTTYEKKTFPGWKELFSRDVGFPIDERWAPGH